MTEIRSLVINTSTSTVGTSDYMSRNRPCAAVHRIVQKHLSEALPQTLGHQPPTGDLLVDIGEIMLRAVSTAVRLSEDLINGKHIEEYTETEIQRMDVEHDFSELADCDYLTGTEKQLRQMLRALQCAASQMRDEWSKAPRRPIRAVSEGSIEDDMSQPSSPEVYSQYHNSIRHSPLAVQTIMSAPAHANYGYSSSAAMNVPLQRMVVQNAYEVPRDVPQAPEFSHYSDIDALKVRGKGVYQCPQGLHCTKGGVIDGQIVTFERNCNYRAHLQKHSRPYRCLLRGCQNKNGFARIDQLRRHQDMVKHDTG